VITAGDPAPAIELADDRGSRWNLADHGDRDVVLIFHRHFY
jgi:peroxiredoxin